MIKGVKKAQVTACKEAVCTTPVDGYTKKPTPAPPVNTHTKKPKPAPPLETPRAVPKGEMQGSIPAVPKMAVPATVRIMAHHRPVEKKVHSFTVKKAVIVSCKKINLRNLKIIRMASLENVTINGLFSRSSKLN